MFLVAQKVGNTPRLRSVNFSSKSTKVRPKSTHTSTTVDGGKFGNNFTFDLSKGYRNVPIRHLQGTLNIQQNYCKSSRFKVYDWYLEGAL